MGKKNIIGIYTELDILVDTRMGTLHRMGEDVAAKFLNTGYYTRQADEFSGIDMEVYRQLYRDRDIETLEVSIMTEGVALIRKLVNDIAEQSLIRPFYDGCKLVVNVYPYLLDAELMLAYQEAIAIKMLGTVEVEMIYAAPERLTPEHCKALYGAMLMYDTEAWLNTQMRALELTPMPEILLMTPLLFHRKNPTKEELDATIKESAHPSQALEWFAASYVELKFIDVAHVCIIRNNSTEQPEPIPD